MDEDFIIEESNPVKVFFTCLFILFVIGAGIGAYYYYDHKDVIKLKNVTVELGTKVPNDISKYLKGQNINAYTLDISLVHTDEAGNTDSVGEYSYKVTKGAETKKGKLFVKDTTPPTAEVRDLTVGVDEDFEVEDFIISCEDLSQICLVSYENTEDAMLNEKEGTYNISIIIKDKYNNSITKNVKLTVSKDESLNAKKTEDLEISDIYPKDDNWNRTFTHKFAKGLDEDSEEYDAKLLEIVNVDYSEKYEQEIIDKTIIVAYNKYGFVLGISVRLTFADNTVKYETK